MSKVEAKSVKVYKPEIMNCPKCGTKLVYVYTVSNKVIHFSRISVLLKNQNSTEIKILTKDNINLDCLLMYSNENKKHGL